jgi:hypothetical protein
VNKLQYKTNCVSSTAKKINDMVDQSREISYKTFRKYVNWKEVSKMFGCALHPKKPGVMLCNDWCVRFFKSKYEGEPCYYVQHSAIEYVFQ